MTNNYVPLLSGDPSIVIGRFRELRDSNVPLVAIGSAVYGRNGHLLQEVDTFQKQSPGEGQMVLIDTLLALRPSAMAEAILGLTVYPWVKYVSVYAGAGQASLAAVLFDMSIDPHLYGLGTKEWRRLLEAYWSQITSQDFNPDRSGFICQTFLEYDFVDSKRGSRGKFPIFLRLPEGDDKAGERADYCLVPDEIAISTVNWALPQRKKIRSA